MKPGEETLGEASQMLRDILKSSGKENPEQQVKDNNNTLKTLGTTPDLSPLNTYCAATATDSETPDMENPPELEKSSSCKEDPVEDNEDRSETSNTPSGDDSDLDRSPGQTNGKDDAQKENDREQDEAAGPTNSPSPSDSKEAKRARVENILTSIRQCPQTGYDSLAQATYNDMKRQKRKQPQPQQHDTKTSLASKSKYRKLECLVLHRHILQLQKQLHAVKKSVSQISRCSSDDEDRDVNSSQEDLENEEAIQGGVLQPADKEAEEPHIVQGFSPRHETELLSSPPLCLNGKVTKEGSENKNVLKDSDSHDPEKGHLLTPTIQPSLISQHVSLSLKSEIIQAVKRAVDSAVITVLEKHAGSVNNQQQQLNHLESASEIQQQHPHSQSPKREDDVQQPLTIPKPRQEREALKETVSNSQTEKPTELIIPFPDHLRILERLSSHRQAPEKPSAFELLLPRSESSDLIKPHTNPTLPFPTHFPFNSYLHAGLLPPLFPPPEPEQTEALPLVVSSATKKKRTKVTDTRLSPKSKATSQQDMDHLTGEAEEDRHPPLSSPFPHPYLPPVLPTSVAITNPSLHHSEVYGGFRFHESVFESSQPPSPGCEGDSAKSPQQDSLQGVGSLKSEILDASAPASPMDGHTMNKTFTLTPMHLRKAKLMFFYTRYPNSGVLKSYFPDVSFNKNNTAQLVKWFSNFREFYYIQMEKFARQAVSEGQPQDEDLVVLRDSELFRQLNLHYNRNNQIEAPESFRQVAETTLREFFRAICNKKDTDSSWKKAIYKVIARLDEPVPEFLKSPNWMEHLGEA
ncbi:uncharacterized protein LOC143296582 [Babylonia areolata]|uniref:uncharacterized protein LOC143296582 n=1 Tax=Babylonia areolata TaxID=304850 RepID=UPI003FD2FCA6